jgi:hypothetical protein
MLELLKSDLIFPSQTTVEKVEKKLQMLNGVVKLCCSF